MKTKSSDEGKLAESIVEKTGVAWLKMVHILEIRMNECTVLHQDIYSNKARYLTPTHMLACLFKLPLLSC